VAVLKKTSHYPASAIASVRSRRGRPKGAKGKNPKWSHLRLSQLGATLSTLAKMYPGASDVWLAKWLKDEDLQVRRRLRQKSPGTPPSPLAEIGAPPAQETLRKRFKQARSVYEAEITMPPGAEAACRAWMEEMTRLGPDAETSDERWARAARVYKRRNGSNPSKAGNVGTRDCRAHWNVGTRDCRAHGPVSEARRLSQLLSDR
jgi:hypothetical protein